MDKIEAFCPCCSYWIRGDTVVIRRKSHRKRQLLKLIQNYGAVNESALYRRARREGLRMGKRTLPETSMICNARACALSRNISSDSSSSADDPYAASGVVPFRVKGINP